MSIAEEPLADDLRASIAKMVAAEHHARGASIEALKLVQDRVGWISDLHLREIAAIIGMSPADLDGVATYFNLIFRKPVGEHVIMLCDSVSCWMLGQEKLKAHLCKRLEIQPGQTTADGKVTLLPIVCLGHCDHAPALLVDQTLYGDVDTQKIDRIIEDLRS